MKSVCVEIDIKLKINIKSQAAATAPSQHTMIKHENQESQLNVEFYDCITMICDISKISVHFLKRKSNNGLTTWQFVFSENKLKRLVLIFLKENTYVDTYSYFMFALHIIGTLNGLASLWMCFPAIM